MQAVLNWISNLGPLGPIAFVLSYILATVLFIPGSLLTLGGGALFGVVLGSVYVFVGATVGATLAFLMGRYRLRNWVSKKIEGDTRFKAIDQAIAKAGFKIVLLTRLSPVFPFSLLNYGLGITQVSLKDYVLGFLGMIPGTILYVYIGSLAGSLAKMATPQGTSPEVQRLQWSVYLVGFVATVGIVFYVNQIARRALAESVLSEEITHATKGRSLR